MTNILNSTLLTQNNIIPARKLKNVQNPKFVEAPKSLPKYSFNKDLTLYSDIRTSYMQELYKTEQKKKKLKKFLTFITMLIPLAVGFLLYKE